MRKSLRLLIATAAVYGTTLYLLRGSLSSEIPSTLAVLVPPLIAVVVILGWDLFVRARVPARPRIVQAVPARRLGLAVTGLSKQIEVGRRSSQNYYDKMLMNRLRDTLVEKISVLTGTEADKVRKTLEDPRLGPVLLHDRELYHLLYTQTSSKGSERVRMIETITDRIDAWKPQ